MWLNELLESVDLCISPDFGNFGHYFSNIFSALLPLSSTLRTNFVRISLCYPTHPWVFVPAFQFFSLSSLEWIFSVEWSPSSLTFSFVTSVLLLSPTSEYLRYFSLLKFPFDSFLTVSISLLRFPIHSLKAFFLYILGQSYNSYFKLLVC